MRIVTRPPVVLRAPTGADRAARTASVVLMLVTMSLFTVSCDRDESLADDVRSRLIVDDTTTDLDLTVTAEQGVVRLSGTTRTQLQHDRALEIAREVAGANSVIDETRVDEHPLAAAVRAAVQRDPLVAEVEVEIDASDAGIVILESSRTNEAQRSRLVQIARGVPGVTGVDDQMK